MKKFLHLAIAMFAAIGVYAQPGPKIQFKSDTIDYGVINKEDDNGIRAFEFTNNGDADLVINDVKPTAGCTVSARPNKPIAPGNSGKIEIKYDMRTGPFRKTVTITSNATNVQDGVVALKLKGEVVEKAKAAVTQKKKSLMDQRQ